MKTITETEQFYGYLIGLQIERCPTFENVGFKLYATFEYGASGYPPANEVTVWEVPDSDLFEILASHLSSMAVQRFVLREYGIDKLWIEKVDGKWRVNLP